MKSNFKVGDLVKNKESEVVGLVLAAQYYWIFVFKKKSDNDDYIKRWVRGKSWYKVEQQ